VVSVNPRHPTQRLQVVLTDTRATVMLTTRGHASRFSEVVPNVIPVDEEQLSRLPSAPPSWTPSQTVKAENVAFVIYTSGSTGTPKGVMLTHSSLCASFRAHGSVYPMDRSTRALQFAAYTFDASISDIWGSLSRGGCVCVISEDERMNGLQGVMDKYGANLAQLTPTVAGLLDAPALSTLETLVLGGEAVKTDVIEGFLRDGRVRVFNGYGPSECSVYTSCHGPLTCSSRPSNIGKVLVGGVWVVNDAFGAVSPVGGVGELWIEGPLLGRGYLDDQAKTDAAFVTSPAWAARHPELHGRRFYRTGDLVRHNAAGEVIYIGRKDTQVKIRGQRVEMGEIEHRAKKALPPPIFKTVAVNLIFPGGKTANPILALSVEVQREVTLIEPVSADVSSEEGQLAAMSDELRGVFEQLHGSLTEVLPSYMVPRLFVPFSRLPSTSSGKLDRRALGRLLEGLTEQGLAEYNLSGSAGGHIAPPTTAAERDLQRLWADLLGVEPDRVGTQDHFLHSGGDSFTAMRLVSKADAAGLPLSVADVFRYPRLADMAAVIDQKRNALLERDAQANDLPPFALWQHVQPCTAEGTAEGTDPLEEQLRFLAAQCGGISVHDVEDVYPCTPLQEGLMAVTAQQPRAYVNRGLYRLPPSLDIARFTQAWAVVAQKAPLLRTRIVVGRLGGALQVVVRGDMPWVLGEDLDRYLAEDDQKPIEYGSPLVRLAILGPSGCQQYFAFTAHHSVYDGWSWARLLDAVAALYHEADKVVPSPPFTRFIQYLRDGDGADAETFWRSQLDGELGSAFPAFPRPSYQPSPTQFMTCRFPARLATGKITTAALLRAAWALVISSHTGGDVVFGTVLAGRTAPVQGILDMLAPTITTVPVRIRADKTRPVSEYLAAVQEQAVSMMPFGKSARRQISQLLHACVRACVRACVVD